VNAISLNCFIEKSGHEGNKHEREVKYIPGGELGGISFFVLNFVTL
jgi:hypothetical protein